MVQTFAFALRVRLHVFILFLIPVINCYSTEPGRIAKTPYGVFALLVTPFRSRI